MAESVDSLDTVAWPTARDPLESGTEVSLTVTRTVDGEDYPSRPVGAVIA